MGTINFCKIRNNALIHRQTISKDGLMFMRAKRRNMMVVKNKGSDVVVNNVDFDGMYHL
jgi:hypothetical protein